MFGNQSTGVARQFNSQGNNVQNAQMQGTSPTRKPSPAANLRNDQNSPGSVSGGPGGSGPGQAFTNPLESMGPSPGAGSNISPMEQQQYGRDQQFSEFLRMLLAGGPPPSAGPSPAMPAPAANPPALAQMNSAPMPGETGADISQQPWIFAHSNQGHTPPPAPGSPYPDTDSPPIPANQNNMNSKDMMDMGVGGDISGGMGGPGLDVASLGAARPGDGAGMAAVNPTPVGKNGWDQFNQNRTMLKGRQA